MNYVNTYVYTPNYSPVPARYNMTWSDHEAGLTMAEAEQINSMFLYIYSSATAGAAVNPSYNCHSFAWHSQLTTNVPYHFIPMVMGDSAFTLSGNDQIQIQLDKEECEPGTYKVMLEISGKSYQTEVFDINPQLNSPDANNE